MREPDPAAVLVETQAHAAAAGFKVLMPVGEATRGQPPRPFLDYVLGSLADAGFVETAVVIGPEHDAVCRRYEHDSVPRRISVSFVVQPEPLGTADAVLVTEAWAGDAPFVVVNGDNLYPVDVLRALRTCDHPAVAAFPRAELLATSNIPPERIAAFALLTADDAGYLARIVEKPAADAVAAAGANSLVGMNCWRFDARIFQACAVVPLSTRGERELPDAVNLAVQRGVRVKLVPAHGPVLDLSRRSDVVEVSARLGARAPDL
ncbi:MAG: sugar phosphate nucleotidyltransferase [Vicinamibacterales bacterium]